MNRTTEQIRGIYDALSKDDLEEAFMAFTESPTAQTWTDMLGAMLVYQQWERVRTSDELVITIWNSSLAHWQDTLVQCLDLGQNVTEAVRNCSK